MDPTLALAALNAFPSLGALAPVAFLDFFDDFGLVVLILVFFALYRYMAGFIDNPLLAILVTVVIVTLLVVPYDWFKYLLFVVVFMFGFWGNVRPWQW